VEEISMTSKNPPKDAPSAETPVAPTREEIQTAYQVHTLSQILYGHLTTTQACGPQPQPPGWPGPYGWYR
jgi:hypothetical protein